MGYLSLFYVFFKIALLTFGGGYAMVPLFQQELVENLALMSAGEFVDLVAIAQVTPGPIGLNSATFAGMISAGVGGAIVASLGVVAPSLVIALLVAMVFKRMNRAKWMNLLMRAVRPCVTGIIAAAVIFFADTSITIEPLVGGIIFLVVCFIRIRFGRLNPIWSLLISAILGWALLM